MYKTSYTPLLLLLLLWSNSPALAQLAAHPEQVSVSLGGSLISPTNPLPVGDTALDNTIVSPGGGFTYVGVQGISDRVDTVNGPGYSTIIGGVVSSDCNPFGASQGDQTAIALDLAQNVCVDLGGQTVNIQLPNYHAGTFTATGCSFTTTAAQCVSITTHNYVSIQNTSATDNVACVWGSATPALNSSTSFMILAGATRSWTATDVGVATPTGALKCIGSATGGTLYIEYE